MWASIYIYTWIADSIVKIEPRIVRSHPMAGWIGKPDLPITAPMQTPATTSPGKCFPSATLEIQHVITQQKTRGSSMLPHYKCSGRVDVARWSGGQVVAARRVAWCVAWCGASCAAKRVAWCGASRTWSVILLKGDTSLQITHPRNPARMAWPDGNDHHSQGMQ